MDLPVQGAGMVVGSDTKGSSDNTRRSRTLHIAGAGNLRKRGYGTAFLLSQQNCGKSTHVRSSRKADKKAEVAVRSILAGSSDFRDFRDSPAPLSRRDPTGIARGAADDLEFEEANIDPDLRGIFDGRVKISAREHCEGQEALIW